MPGLLISNLVCLYYWPAAGQGSSVIFMWVCLLSIHYVQALVSMLRMYWWIKAYFLSQNLAFCWKVSFCFIHSTGCKFIFTFEFFKNWWIACHQKHFHGMEIWVRCEWTMWMRSLVGGIAAWEDSGPSQEKRKKKEASVEQRKKRRITDPFCSCVLMGWKQEKNQEHLSHSRVLLSVWVGIKECWTRSSLESLAEIICSIMNEWLSVSLSLSTHT